MSVSSGGPGVTSGVRRLLFLTAVLSAATGFVALPALPAHASVGLQNCQLVKGRFAASPGLSDVPTDQTITLATRVTGCSRAGGSAILAASIAAPRATCASLTTSLLPTTATFAWANGRISTVSFAFSSVPGASNRVAMSGRVLSGAGIGDRVDGGLHLERDVHADRPSPTRSRPSRSDGHAAPPARAAERHG